MMLFSIIIPTCNNLERLKDCLAAINRFNSKDFEVLICIDGSTDGTREYLDNSQWDFSFKYFLHPDNLHKGRAATRNLALAYVQGKFILFLDSDMIPREDLLQKHLDILNTSPSSVSIGSINYLNKENNVWVKYLSTRGVGKFTHEEEIPYNYFIVPNTAMPSAYFIKSGGFDEQLSGYGGEDMEFGYRIQKHFNTSFYCNSKAVVDSIQHKKLSEALKEHKEYASGNLPAIIKKHPELKQVYWADKITSNGLNGKFLRTIAYLPLKGIIMLKMTIFPFCIQKTLISYLIFCSITKGLLRK
jgi:glycosyltransferase involved in cell wall biosynthesis